MKWNKRIVLLKASKYIIIICLALSVVLAAYTIYGNKVGNFVISINDSSRQISLCSNDSVLSGDYSSISTRLLANGLSDMTDSSYNDIPNDIQSGIGTKNDTEFNRYFCYSFYLVNKSGYPLDYSMYISITEAKLNIDSCIRVMVIENDNESKCIYAKRESSDKNLTYLLEHTAYSVTDYFHEDYICKTTTMDFKDSAIKKYTVVIWVEGWDKDTNDDIIGGTIKMKMCFDILS